MARASKARLEIVAAPDDESETSLRSRQKKATRKEILRSAEICFAQKGYQSTTLDDVAAMTRVSRAAVYFHFQGKQQIVSALIRQALDDGTNVYKALPTPAAYAADARSLDLWVQALLNNYRKFRDRRIVLRQAQSADAMSRRTIAEVAKEYIDLVAERIGLPEGASKDVSLVRTRIRLAIVTSDAICYIWALDQTLSRVEAADELKMMWSRVVTWASLAKTRAKANTF